MKTIKALVLILVTVVLINGKSHAHCEIPCGIFEDSVRVSLLYEHIVTIEKSMKKIKELQAAENVDYNQLVRWIMNKEEHAKKMQEIVAQYFMHQRIKPVDETEKERYEKYIEQLTSLHEIAIFAMKSKQSTDEVYIKKMRAAVHDFEHAYFHTHKH